MSITVEEAKDTVKQWYRRLYETKDPFSVPAVVLVSAPGAGKSMSVRQACQELSNELGIAIELRDIRLSQYDPTDIKGLPRFVDNNVEWTIPTIWPRSGYGILFFDEINLAPPAVQAACYRIILDRSLENWELPEGWMIVAAMNPPEQAQIAFPIPPPLRNRMVFLDIRVDWKTWFDWAIKRGIHPDIISFLAPEYRRESYLLKFSLDKPFPSPRSWEFVHKILKMHLSEPELKEAIIGAVGPEVALEFFAWRRLGRTVGDIPRRIIFGEKVDIKPILEGEETVEGHKFRRLDLLYFILTAALESIGRIKEMSVEEAATNYAEYLLYLYERGEKEPETFPREITVTFGAKLLELFPDYIPGELLDVISDWVISGEITGTEIRER